ncbi:hypothetical protein ACWDO0_07870 [Nocardia rhamnosiphila]
MGCDVDEPEAHVRTEEVAAVLTRHAPLAVPMSAFMHAFQQESRSTPYSDQEIRRLLDGRACAEP